MDSALVDQKASAVSPPKDLESGPNISSFRLDNGLEVVVIPDHRAPVVTHMVWYRNGSADDPPGKSGIAHFLEHLMFKGTAAHPQGEFSKVIAELGGQENAFTGNDYTAYFQRVAKQHLPVMMAFEADRMTGLQLTDEVVAPERADALAYYQRFYTPQNAVLIVAGDVEPEEVRRLAEETYGKIKPLGETPQRRRPKEPPQLARRTVTVNDEKVEQPVWQRCYLTPSYRTAAPGEAEALEVLAHILGGGQTSLLYRILAVEERIAAAAGAQYMGTTLDDTRFFLYALPAPGVTLEQLEQAVDRVLAQFLVDGIDEATLERAKTRLIADAVYAQDSQAMLARWYGASLSTGLTIDDVKQWPARIDAVGAAAVLDAAKKHLDRRKAVSGFLLPEEKAAA